MKKTEVDLDQLVQDSEVCPMNKSFENELKNEVSVRLKSRHGLDWKTVKDIYKTMGAKKLNGFFETSIDKLTDDLYKTYLFKKTNHMNLSEKYHTKKSDMTLEWLKEYFGFSEPLSDNRCSVYLRRFPAFKWNGIVLLDAEIKASYPNKGIEVNCYDYGTNNPYAAFYYVDCGDYTKLLESIDKRILAEFKKLGISI